MAIEERSKNVIFFIHPKNTGEMKLKRIQVLWTAILLSSLTLSVYPHLSWGWGYGHAQMTIDALEGLADSRWTHDQIALIAEFDVSVDEWFPHPQSSCHRVSTYQREFQAFGGASCCHPGAEYWAKLYVESARQHYASGDHAEGDRSLGYAIHYIQDAMCPPHVFPFSEDAGSHFEFVYVTAVYGDMSSRVRNAPQTQIASGELLESAILEFANCVRGFSCEYVTPNGTIIGNPPDRGWWLSDGDIGNCMEMASRLVKGAAVYARFGLSPVKQRIEVSSHSFYSPPLSVGDTFTATISVHDWSYPTFYGYELELRYDPYILEAVAAQIPDNNWLTWDQTINETCIVYPPYFWGDRVGFGALLLRPPLGKTGSGTLATVTFKILRAPSIDPLSYPDRSTNLTLDSEDALVVRLTIDSDGRYDVVEIPKDMYRLCDGKLAIKIGLQADLNGDGRINILDIVIVAKAYGSKPGDPKWNATADLDKNGVIDILDICRVAKDYGKKL
jgi:hypothetical protein